MQGSRARRRCRGVIMQGLLLVINTVKCLGDRILTTCNTDMGNDLCYPSTQKKISKRSSTGIHLLTGYIQNSPSWRLQWSAGIWIRSSSLAWHRSVTIFISPERQRDTGPWSRIHQPPGVRTVTAQSSCQAPLIIQGSRSIVNLYKSFLWLVSLSWLKILLLLVYYTLFTFFMPPTWYETSSTFESQNNFINDFHV